MQQTSGPEIGGGIVQGRRWDFELVQKHDGEGIVASLMVAFDPQEGFTDEADRFIKDLTIVTEYTGDVNYLENWKDDDGDSMMMLLSTSNPSRSLVICPDKRANIDCFINSINLYSGKGSATC
ncbi:hypothetical protein MLD38_002953 [Melastoma candidum]|uniref:Uncharacterized protein n=1 Tax=Melastoma candidum TaxID=119954 RepID=A0ACB9S0N1_9MYRT|nr:hypothetical protein MLD38_002953 [Melastoma candidum]